ncbi:hypothetical protein [Allosphingosinicella sp.]|uniref:hypothetical protein n=1 Tax=Allosphingosinicella sp. TaxID=2823234 RepID=UPI003783212D
MTFDLRGAMLKKEEFESARLAEFDYRWRARTMRLLAAALDPALSADEMAAETARQADGAILADLAARYPTANVAGLYDRARAEARKALIAELGDPTPHRLA